MNHTSTIKTVLFDLDGTLLDTAPDLIFSLNQLLAYYKKPELPFAKVRAYAADGVQGLIKLAFNIEPQHADYAGLRQQFLAYYQQFFLQQSALFPEIQSLLEQLLAQDFKLGLVTNKPAQFTRPMLQHLALNKYFAAIVCVDEVTRGKPHPDPILRACEELQSLPEECIYVGDTLIDVLAARAAVMPSLIVRYGYQHDNEDINQWGATAIIENPKQIMAWINQFNGLES